jgi:caffeoyl-CoA O-methyltransferase
MNFISPNLNDYCENHSSDEPKVLQEIARKTYLTQLNPRMLSGHLQGRFLQLLTQIINPVKVLEIGTYTGYSAICMAMGLGEKSVLHTIEIDEELLDGILENFEKAGVSSKIQLHIGNGLDIIPELLKDNDFDLIFMDADKENYCAYFLLLKDQLKSGAVIITDNVLWNGKILDEAELKNDPSTAAIHQFNEMLSSDQNFEKVVLPIRDGISIARKR